MTFPFFGDVKANSNKSLSERIANSSTQTANIMQKNNMHFNNMKGIFRKYFIKSYIFYCSTLLIFLLTACKKEKQEDVELPTLGTCKPVAAAGHLTIDPAGVYTFKTSGSGTIEIDLSYAITITHDKYPGFTIELWGVTPVNGQTTLSGNHENLDGKHIKDRLGNRRTIIFPDGAKITVVSDGKTGPITSISIYDGAESHHINGSCRTLEYSSTNEAITQALDDAEADGEASTFEFLYGSDGVTITGLLWVNIYTEDTPGNKVQNRVKLGQLDRANPNQVIDYYP